MTAKHVFDGSKYANHSARPEKLMALAASLEDQVIGGIRIHEATANVEIGQSDEPMVQLHLLMSDPDAAEVSWPSTSLVAIDHFARSRAHDLGIDEWLHITHLALRDVDYDAWRLRSRYDVCFPKNVVVHWQTPGSYND